MTVASQELYGVGRHAAATREMVEGCWETFVVSWYKYLGKQNLSEVQTAVERRPPVDVFPFRELTASGNDDNT